MWYLEDSFHKVGAKAKNALVLVKDSWISLRLSITSRFLSTELFWGIPGEVKIQKSHTVQGQIH